MIDKLNIAVFASGKGSNFRAILESIQSGRIFNAKIALVISNNSDAGVLQIARENHIPAFHISRKYFSSDEDFNSELMKKLHDHDVNFIALAGYMKKIDSRIIRAFRNRIVNIHPALLPQYGGNGMFGDNVHKAVIAHNDKFSGATVHLVDEEYDHGPIVLQQIVPVGGKDTVETLKARILEVEHKIYPEALRLFAEDKVTIVGQKVVISW